MSNFVKFTDDEIYKAAHTNIKEWLESHGEKVKQSGTEWLWAAHDSVKIRGHVWYQWSTDDSGTAIDFLCNFYHMSFPDAVRTLLNCKPVTLTPYEKAEVIRINNSEKSPILLPPHNDSCARALAYLCKTRCLDFEVVAYFMKLGLIYESADKHNVVFVGKDKFGTARHCTVKGTLTNKPYRGEIKGSDKQYSFNKIGRSTIMYIFEAPIDLMSYITLKRPTNKNWSRFTYLATCGLTRLPIDRVLADYPYINTLVFCYDNDTNKEINRGQTAAEKFRTIYEQKGFKVKFDTPPQGDWNDVLQSECEANG